MIKVAAGTTRRHRLGGGPLIRRISPDDGVVAVEFALVAPLFLLLVFGTMIFALYFATFVAVIHAASEGARASIAGLTNAEREQMARARVEALFQAYQPLLKPGRATTLTQPVLAGAVPSYRVSVTYPISDFGFDWFFGFMNAVSGGGGAAPTTVSYSITVANGGY
jgi:Flp pilus assembly protein TadG